MKMNDYKPEVGVECEFLHGKFGWRKCNIIAVESSRVIAEDLEFSCEDKEASMFFYRDTPLRRDDFRPIRTQQEIEREEAIKDAFKNIGWGDPNYLVPPSCIEVVIDMINAGYHNGPKVGEEIDPLCFHNIDDEAVKFLKNSYAVHRKIK